MKKIMRLFMSQYEIYLDPSYCINCFQSPKKLIKQLSSKNPQSHLQEFIAAIKSPTNNIYDIMQRLTLLSLLMLHSDCFYEIICDILPFSMIVQPTQQYLYQSFIVPYQKFLLKCCNSSEIYSQVKIDGFPSNKESISFQNIFYIINLLNKLFPSVDKTSTLGRYYKTKTQLITNNYVHMASAQAVRLYISLKNIVHQMINSPQIYLYSKEKQKLMKGLLNQSVANLNQDMKRLILNKYYVPFKHGYKTKLFRNQEDIQQLAKSIHSINCYKKTDRSKSNKKNKKNLERKSINYCFSPQKTFIPNLLEYSIGQSLNSLDKKTSAQTREHPKKPSFEVKVFEDNQEQLDTVEINEQRMPRIQLNLKKILI